MEKAIVKTLIYADIFEFPLNIFEIHKWLIEKKATLRQVESALSRLVKNSQLRVQKGYFYLSDKDGLVVKRRRRKKQSERYLKKARTLTTTLRIIPWIKLVGISGGLAMENAEKQDDIDLFLVVSKNRLWLSRILALGLLSLTGQRRKLKDSPRKIAGKLCLNILLEEDRLAQYSKDIYLAHEVLQMKVLWQKNGVYRKYLEDNNWAFKFLPNWVGSIPNVLSVLGDKLKSNNPPNIILDMCEKLAKQLQLSIMGSPKGMERIQDGAVYFHPNDCRMKVLSEYQKRVKEIYPERASASQRISRA